MILLLLGLCVLSATVGLVLIDSRRRVSLSAGRRRPVSRLASESAMRWRDWVSAGAAALALLLVLGAVLALFLVPLGISETVRVTGSGEVVTTRETSPLIRSSGWTKVAAVAAAALILAVGLRLGRPPRAMLFVLGYVAAAFCLVTGFSIGLFFLPVPILLLLSASLSPPRGQHPPRAVKAGR